MQPDDRSSEAPTDASPTGGDGGFPIDRELARRIPAFRTLSDDDLATILGLCTIRKVARAVPIFKAGVLGDGLYAILDGSVSIVKPNAKGGEREVATLERHELFGEMDLISDRPHTSGARAAEATTLLFLPKDAFQGLLAEGCPAATQLVIHFARMLAGRLDANNKRMMEMLERPAEPASSEFAEFKRRLLKEWTF